MSDHKFLLKRSKEPISTKVVSPYKLRDLAAPSSDLSKVTPPIYNQGNAGLCFSHAGVRIFDMEHFKKTGKFFEPSRLFVGIMTRKDEGTLSKDAGATLRGTVNAMTKYGVTSECNCPYDIRNMFQLPSDFAMTDALNHQVLENYSIPSGDIDLMRKTLTNGYAIVFGAIIYTSFKSEQVARTGIVPMPAFWEGKIGGHALTLIGHDDARKMFLVANSWGSEWGLKDRGYEGFCWMPYEYFQGNSRVWDMWVISKEEIA